ncbi:unnamed protein product, partial [Prorocentrum cordatum]
KRASIPGAFTCHVFCFCWVALAARGTCSSGVDHVPRRPGSSDSRARGAREIRAAGLAAAGAMQRVFFAVSASAAIASAARSFRAVAAGERASASGTSGVAADDAEFELTLRAPGAEGLPRGGARSSSLAPQKSRRSRFWLPCANWRSANAPCATLLTRESATTRARCLRRRARLSGE